MKLFTSIILFISIHFTSMGQTDTELIDSRDGHRYQTKDIDGRRWMLENLVLETDLSFGLPDTLKQLNPSFKGRWYHMNEIDTLCPVGWRLPNVHDWIHYFDHLSKNSDGDYEMNTLKDTYNLAEFDQYFDLFEEGNPLEIIPAGIYQGDKFLYAPHSADYWIVDLKTRKEGDIGDFKLVKKSYPGTAHIHLYNQYTNIHSHNFNLEPDKPFEIRRFLCRCVKE